MGLINSRTADTVQLVVDELNSQFISAKALVADQEFTAWLEKRTPAGRWVDKSDLVDTAVYLAPLASSFCKWSDYLCRWWADGNHLTGCASP